MTCNMCAGKVCGTDICGISCGTCTDPNNPTCNSDGTACICSEVPTAVTGFSANTSGSTVTLSWNAIALPNVAYKIQVKSALNGSTSFGAYTDLTETTNTTYTHNITATSRYKYKIIPKVCGVYGNSGTEVESSDMGCINNGTAPTGLALTAGNAKITATWNAVTNATSYKLYRTGYSTNTFTITAPTVTYQDTGLVNNQSYNYQVSAIVCGGESTKTAQLSKTPLDAIPCPSGATVPNYNGITYNTVWIDINENGVENTGECWFKENLATTKKPDTTNLLHALSGDYAYMCPPNTSNNAEDCTAVSSGSTSVLGNIYTWATAMNLASSCNTTNCSGSINSPHQGICPSGWHIPTDTEWANLINYAENIAVPTTGSTCATAGACSNAGKVMKETGTAYWNSTGGSPTNSLGFTMRGAGCYAGGWSGRGTSAYLWSASQNSSSPASVAMSRNWSDSNAAVYRVGDGKTYLWSVRCVKN